MAALSRARRRMAVAQGPRLTRLVADRFGRHRPMPVHCTQDWVTIQ